MTTRLRIFLHLIATRRTLARLRTREDVLTLQAARLRRQLDRISRTVPYYRDCAGKPLAEWPVVDKAESLRAFGLMNSVGISAESAWAAAEAGLREANSSGRIGRISVGTSTGTSGNRGLFLVSPAERAWWLGSIVARTLPRFPWRSYRVAVILATANELYDTSARSGRMAFRFFDVRNGVSPDRAEIEAFAPDVVVAPPKALRLMADERFAIAPAHLFSGGEVLDPADTAVIVSAFGVVPRPIYQATEGFLGVACEAGTLHLNEDSMLFEFEQIPDAPGHVQPVITDLVRSTQAMIRYRMGDVLVLGGGCRCGSPLQAVARIEGRIDDVLTLPSARHVGALVPVMPEAVRTAIVDADRSIADFRVVQTGERTVTVRLPAGTPGDVAEAVRAFVLARLADLSVVATVDVSTGIEAAFGTKLRRVTRDWRG